MGGTQQPSNLATQQPTHASRGMTLQEDSMRFAFVLLSVLATTPVAIREWTVPWEDTRPRDPAVDASGKVWFVGQTGHYIARLDPATGKFDRFELDAGTGPHNLIVGSDGAVWFAGNRKAYIGRLEPKNGKI